MIDKGFIDEWERTERDLLKAERRLTKFQRIKFPLFKLDEQIRLASANIDAKINRMVIIRDKYVKEADARIARIKATTERYAAAADARILKAKNQKDATLLRFSARRAILLAKIPELAEADEKTLRDEVAALREKVSSMKAHYDRERASLEDQSNV